MGINSSIGDVLQIVVQWPEPDKQLCERGDAASSPSCMAYKLSGLGESSKNSNVQIKIKKKM